MHLRPTHDCLVEAEVKTGENDLGSPLYDQRPVLECPVRFHSPDGQSYVPTPSGELKQEQPSVMLPIYGTAVDAYGTDYGEYDGDGQLLVHEHIEEGAAVTLDGLGGTDDWTADAAGTYQVDGVGVKRARGGRPERVELTLQRNPD